MDNSTDTQLVDATAHDDTPSFVPGAPVPVYRESNVITKKQGTIEIAPKVVEVPDSIEVVNGNQEIQKPSETVPANPKSADEEMEDTAKSSDQVSTIAAEVVQDKVVDMSTHHSRSKPVSDSATGLTRYADEKEAEFIDEVEELAQNGTS